MYKNNFFSAQQNKILHQTQGPPQKSNTIITVHVLSAIVSVIFSGNTCLKVVVFIRRPCPACYHWWHVRRTHYAVDDHIFCFLFYFSTHRFFFSVLNIFSYRFGIESQFLKVHPTWTRSDTHILHSWTPTLATPVFEHVSSSPYSHLFWIRLLSPYLSVHCYYMYLYICVYIYIYIYISIYI